MNWEIQTSTNLSSWAETTETENATTISIPFVPSSTPPGKFYARLVVTQIP